MAYETSGMQAMFPIYLSRMPEQGADRDAYDIAAAQNEANLNQNLSILADKIAAIESYLSEAEG